VIGRQIQFREYAQPRALIGGLRNQAGARLGVGLDIAGHRGRLDSGDRQLGGGQHERRLRPRKEASRTYGLHAPG
jgi:hypothetical protein